MEEITTASNSQYCPLIIHLSREALFSSEQSMASFDLPRAPENNAMICWFSSTTKHEKWLTETSPSNKTTSITWGTPLSKLSLTKTQDY